MTWNDELVWYGWMPKSCHAHVHRDAWENEDTCEDCKAFMDYVRTHE